MPLNPAHRDAAQIARRTKARIAPAVRAAVIARDGMTCRHCGQTVRERAFRHDHGHDTIELDHITPVREGGASTAENLVVSCLICNRRRWNCRPRMGAASCNS